MFLTVVRYHVICMVGLWMRKLFFFSSIDPFCFPRCGKTYIVAAWSPLSPGYYRISLSILRLGFCRSQLTYYYPLSDHDRYLVVIAWPCYPWVCQMEQMFLTARYKLPSSPTWVIYLHGFYIFFSKGIFQTPSPFYKWCWGYSLRDFWKNISTKLWITS